MDGAFYVDSKLPFPVTSVPAVSLTAAYQVVAPISVIPALGPNYFNYVGKAIRIRAMGQATSVATPGNLTFSYLWNNGVTAGAGTLVCGVALVWIANQTNQCFTSEVVIRCRSLGATGSLFGMGFLFLQGTGIIHMPASAPAAVTVDLTQPN
ncbi:MAG: hypothetical protein ACQSGP_13830, partial [Frankia sp.]